jgi:hypothetical protein
MVMAKMKKWLVFDEDGKMHQVLTNPGEDPPEGHIVRATTKHTTDPACEWFDLEKGRWVKDNAKREKLDKENRRSGVTRGELVDRVEALEAQVATLLERINAQGQA